MLDIVLQGRIGPQRDLVDREFAGVCAAHRDEIDQCSCLVDLTVVEPGTGGNILVGTLTQETSDAAGHAVDFRLQSVGNIGPDRRQLFAPHRIVAEVKFGPQAAYAIVKGFEMLGDVMKMPALYLGPHG